MGCRVINHGLCAACTTPDVCTTVEFCNVGWLDFNGNATDGCEKAKDCSVGSGGEIDRIDCKNGAEASGITNSCSCICLDGYTGTLCEVSNACVAVDIVAAGGGGGSGAAANEIACLNSGSASGAAGNCSCTCVAGYGGDLCETALPCKVGTGSGANEIDCMNGNDAAGITGSCTCACDSTKFLGEKCQIENLTPQLQACNSLAVFYENKIDTQEAAATAATSRLTTFEQQQRVLESEIITLKNETNMMMIASDNAVAAAVAEERKKLTSKNTNKCPCNDKSTSASATTSDGSLTTPTPSNAEAESILDDKIAALESRNKELYASLTECYNYVMILAGILFCLLALLSVYGVRQLTNKRVVMPVDKTVVVPVATNDAGGLTRIKSRFNHTHFRQAVVKHKAQLHATGVMDVAEDAAKAHASRLHKRKAMAKLNLQRRLKGRTAVPVSAPAVSAGNKASVPAPAVQTIVVDVKVQEQVEEIRVILMNVLKTPKKLRSLFKKLNKKKKVGNADVITNGKFEKLIVGAVSKETFGVNTVDKSLLTSVWQAAKGGSIGSTIRRERVMMWFGWSD